MGTDSESSEDPLFWTSSPSEQLNIPAVYSAPSASPSPASSTVASSTMTSPPTPSTAVASSTLPASSASSNPPRPHLKRSMKPQYKGDASYYPGSIFDPHYELVRGVTIDNMVETVNERKKQIEGDLKTVFGRTDKVVLHTNNRIKILCEMEKKGKVCNVYPTKYNRHMTNVHGVDPQEANAYLSYYIRLYKYLTKIETRGTYRPIQCIHCSVFVSQIEEHLQHKH